MSSLLKLPRLAVVAGALVLALVAAGAGLANRSSATKSTELKLALPSGGVDHLDPGLWYFATTWKISLATCTPLLTFPDRSGEVGKKVVGGIAQLPSISGGGRVYTFKIKPGLKFPNGQPINAKVEKGTLERLFAKKLASPASGFFNVIQGSDAYASGDAKTISGIKAAGNTLTIRLTAPVGSFLKRMTVPWTCPVPLGTSAAPNEKGGLLLDGPYIVSSYTPDRQLVLVRNPAYNAKQLGNRGHYDKITIGIGVDASQAELEIKAGQLDSYLDRLPPAAANTDLRDPSLKGRVFVNPTPSVTYLWLNNDVPPLNNPKVRQAINYALDRNQILRVWGGPSQGQVTDQILPPTMGGFRDAKLYPASGNVAKAKALLAAAHAKLPLHVTLRTRSDSPGFPEVAQAVQAQLAKVGIDATVKTAPDSVNGGVIGTPKNKIPMGINNWTQDYPDGDDFFGPLLDGQRITPTNNNNYASFNSAYVNSQINKIAPLVGARRDAAWENLDITTMRRFAPWAPLFNPAWVDLLSSHVTGYVYTPVYGLDMTQLQPK